VCVSAECIRRGIVPDPHPFLRIPCIRRTLVTLKEIFLFYAIATTHSGSRLAPHIFSEFTYTIIHGSCGLIASIMSCNL
jgi:hypothetical protein